MSWTNRNDALMGIMDVVQNEGRVRIGYNKNGDRKFYAVPFGVTLPNYGTFGKSVFDLNSSLVRLLVWLKSAHWDGRSTTKKDICEGVFGFIIARTGETLRFDRNRNTWYPVNLSGWRSPWFAGIRKAGFVTKVGKHFVLTDLGHYVVEYHYPTS